MSDSVMAARIKWLAQEAESFRDPSLVGPFVRSVCAKYEVPVPRAFWPIGEDGQPYEPRHYVLKAEPGRYVRS